MKSSIVVLLTLLLAPLALAQPQGGGQGGQGGRGGGRMVEQYREILATLNLSEEQKAKTDEILAAAPEKLQKLRDETADLDPQDRRQRMMEAMTEIRGEIDAQLTAEQKEQFETKIQEMRQQMRDRAQGQGQGQGQGRGFNLVGRLEEALATLNLSGEQKTQADKIVSELRTKSEEIRAAADNDPQAAREKAREAFTAARDELLSILDQDQREKLREALQPPGGEGRGRGAEPPAPPGAPPATRPSSDAGNTQPTAEAVGLSFSSTVMLNAGDRAPTFELADLNDRKVALSSLLDRPTLIIFASHSSPLFRDKVKQINQFRRDVGARINFAIVYTREAHAEGEWQVERNRDDNIKIAQHTDTAARLAAAKKAAKMLSLEGPILIDDMSDTAFRAYGGTPTAAALVGRDGKIILFQKWLDVHAVRRAVAEMPR